jgi:hypothetical protein
MAADTTDDGSGRAVYAAAFLATIGSATGGRRMLNEGDYGEPLTIPLGLTYDEAIRAL